MDLSLRSRRALVCGASQGIGRAAALELTSLGAEVTLLARDQSALEKVLGELPAGQLGHGQRHGVLAADLSQTDALAKALAGAIDPARPFHILVNNAGGPPGGPAHAAEVAAYEAAFRTHVLANQVLLAALLPGMKAAKFGRVINIISTSVKAPIPDLGVSNTIRAAVASWAKTLASELGPFGITVNNVLPGFTRTQRLESLFASKAQKSGRSVAQIEEEAMASTPLRRFADPSEVAAAVAFLASPAASYINGINLPVDGGRTPSL